MLLHSVTMSKFPEDIQHTEQSHGDSVTHSLAWATGKPLEKPSLVSAAPDLGLCSQGNSLSAAIVTQGSTKHRTSLLVAALGSL